MAKKKSSAKETASQNKRLLLQLKKKKEGALDRQINELDKKAFQTIDCLTCANCCKTTGPLFTDKDIVRIAKHLRLKPGKFVENYLRIDEDNDYVLQQLPCPFLDHENYCTIYNVRPKACAEYPHTQMRGQKKMLPLMLKNAEICPAVENILTELKKHTL